MYSNIKDSSIFLSLGRHVDVYFPSRKRSRISAPFVVGGNKFEQKEQVSIDVLPDECLFEILRRLPEGQDKSACACVSKRWLMLLSNIQRDEVCSNKTTESLKPKDTLVSKTTDESFVGQKKSGDGVIPEAEDLEIESDGYLSRCLEGRKATDVRLAAISVGTGGRGGLGKLLIRGSKSGCRVTDLGLGSIARGCPSLRVLSLWNVSSIADDGLIEIANGCHQLEKLDLCGCPTISDKALVAIAKNCRNLTALTIESCPRIGNAGLQAIGQFCPNLKSISIKNCPLVGDQGVASLLTSVSCALAKVKLHALNITDMSLAVIGHYGKAVIDLDLAGLPNVGERGFWVMGSGHGLQKLKSLAITSCQGVTDMGLVAVGKGCPNLKQFCLRKSAFLSDNGLASLAKVAASLESLQLEECHYITQFGVFGAIVSCSGRLKSLTLVSCFGIKDHIVGLPVMTPCKSLNSLSIRNCPGFGNVGLCMMGKLCPQLESLDLSGAHRITDAGFLPLIESCEASLMKVNLSGCMNLSDSVVTTLAKVHGGTLEQLNLDNCQKVTDASMFSIAENCGLLTDLDVSKTAITDRGIAALASAKQLSVQILCLSGCSLISNQSVPFLEKLGQTLLGLNLQQCNGISSSMVNLLLERLWRCDILF